MLQVHNFCFIAVDDVGYTTERRCVILNADSVIPLLNAPTPPTTTRQQKPTTTLPPVVDVFSMMNFMIPKKQNAFEGYGCCGAGNMDHNTKNFGLPVDDVDRSLNSRKRCIRCVVKTFQMEYTTYTYNQKTNRCGKNYLLSTPEVSATLALSLFRTCCDQSPIDMKI